MTANNVTGSDRQPGIITLPEAVEAGMFGHRTYHAVRKQLQRDPGAPSPITPGYQGGPVHLYDVNALREYASAFAARHGLVLPPEPPADATPAAEEAASVSWMSLRDYGFSIYESADDGFGRDQRPIRSIDRMVGGRRLKGIALATKLGTHGYLEVKVYNDEGKQETRTVHSLVMLPRVGLCPPGMQTRHYDDDPFNNVWRPGTEEESVAAGGNLFYGTRPEQEADRYRNGRPRPAPRPERHCVRCGVILTTNGKRCHDCVVELGQLAAPLLRSGGDPVDVAAALDYPSADGIVKLAVVHGGYGKPRRKRWLHTVTATVRDIFHGTERGHGK